MISTNTLTNERLANIERLLIINGKDALNVEETAFLLGVTPGRIRHLASDREIPHYKRGGKLYFSKHELFSWMLDERIPTNKEIEAIAMNFQ